MNLESAIQSEVSQKEKSKGWKMVGWCRLNGREFEQALEDGEGRESLVCCSPRGREELDMTEQQPTTHI